MEDGVKKKRDPAPYECGQWECVRRRYLFLFIYLPRCFPGRLHQLTGRRHLFLRSFILKSISLRMIPK